MTFDARHPSSTDDTLPVPYFLWKTERPGTSQLGMFEQGVVSESVSCSCSLVPFLLVQHVLQQRIVVIDPRYVQPVQQHVGDAEHIGELLFLDAVDGAAEGRAVVGGPDLLFQLLEPAREKAARSAGKVNLNAVFDTKVSVNLRAQ